MDSENDLKDNLQDIDNDNAEENELEEVEIKTCIIKDTDYILKQVDDHSNCFDLYLLTIVNKGKPNQKFTFKQEACGCKIETCVKLIRQYRYKQSKNFDINKYINLYKLEKSLLKFIR